MPAPVTGVPHFLKAQGAKQVPIEGAVSGKQYEVVEGFFRRPMLVTFVEVADVDVDADDNVYVLTRSANVVMVFDKSGLFLHSWGRLGQGSFSIPHGLSIGPDGLVYTTDQGNHTVRKWTKDGKLLATIGRDHYNAPEYSGQPFAQPTQTAVAPNGDMYVSDGYGNAHVHCFDSAGNHKFSIGGHGGGPGEFDTIHSVYIDHHDEGKLYIADRYNNRVQILSAEGKFLNEWTGLRMPNSVRKGPDGNFAVAELGHRVSIFDAAGNLVSRWGDDAKAEDVGKGGGLPTSAANNPVVLGKVMHEPGAGQFCAPHGITIDSSGAIYVADVAETYVGLDRGGRAIQKFVPV